jgi:hypothetical protein
MNAFNIMDLEHLTRMMLLYDRTKSSFRPLKVHHIVLLRSQCDLSWQKLSPPSGRD